MTSKLLALTMLCMTAVGVSQAAEASSVDFSCPKAETIVVNQQTFEPHQAESRYIGTWQSDPYVCKSGLPPYSGTRQLDTLF
jgi:hypothetical protein